MEPSSPAQASGPSTPLLPAGKEQMFPSKALLVRCSAEPTNKPGSVSNHLTVLNQRLSLHLSRHAKFVQRIDGREVESQCNVQSPFDCPVSASQSAESFTRWLLTLHSLSLLAGSQWHTFLCTYTVFFNTKCASRMYFSSYRHIHQTTTCCICLRSC